MLESISNAAVVLIKFTGSLRICNVALLIALFEIVIQCTVCPANSLKQSEISAV